MAPGRLRLATTRDFSAKSLNAFIAKAIASGATIQTDAWAGYADPRVKGHRRRKVGPMAAQLVLPLGAPRIQP